MGERQRVELLAIPVAAARAVMAYCNDMIREMQLIEVGRAMDDVAPSELDSVASGLRVDLEWLRDDFGGHMRPTEEGFFADPATDPERLVDVAGHLLPDAAIRIQRVVDQFEELNWFSSHGQLLTSSASPVVMNLVRWLRREVVGQLAEGRNARPFTVPVP